MTYDPEAHKRARAKLAGLTAKLAAAEAALPGELLGDDLDAARRAEKAIEELRARVRLCRNGVVLHEKAERAAKVESLEREKASVVVEVAAVLAEADEEVEAIEAFIGMVPERYRRHVELREKAIRMVIARPDLFPLLSAHDLTGTVVRSKIQSIGGPRSDPALIDVTGLHARAVEQSAGVVTYLTRSRLPAPIEDNEAEAVA